MRPRHSTASALVTALGLAACGTDPAEQRAPEAPATAAPSASAPRGRAGFVLPDEVAPSTNPLKLPPPRGGLPKAEKVFAVTERALRGAALGKVMPLERVHVDSVEGGDLVVRVPGSYPYRVHPAYCIALPEGRPRHGRPVLVAHRGKLRHGVVTSLGLKQLGVRFVDDGDNRGEQAVDVEDVAPASPGLAPGTAAVFRDPKDGAWRHVLLVSSADYADGKRRWLALDYGSVALQVDEAVLRPLPFDLKLKVGAQVWVPDNGHMQPGEVRELQAPGLVLVKRPIIGGLSWVGPGWVMLPPAS
ncbi:MAG: hypothetical protein HY908_36400 [Myxococcales bacterium]|nr:hypothetical protein [Myxococcales bacterium]